MNVVRGKVIGGDDGIGVDLGDQVVRLGEVGAARFPGLGEMVGRDVAFGVRPEALGGDGSGSLTMHVELVEMLGSELLVHGTVHAPAVKAIDTGVEQSDKPSSMMIASIDPRRKVDVDHPLTLAVDINRVHLFDLDTGLAIGRG